MAKSDHERIIEFRVELKRIRDRFDSDKEALLLAAAQWPTREEITQELQTVREAALIAGIPRPEFESAVREVSDKLQVHQDNSENRFGKLERDTITSAAHRELLDKVESLEAFRNRAIGIAPFAGLITAAIGAAIVRALGG